MVYNMPVKFFPEKPIELLEKYIIKDDGNPLFGEIEVYRKLFSDLSDSQEEWSIWHDLKLPVHSDVFNDYHKASAQLDFLVLSNEGVIVLEVKGGYVSLRENTFYYGKNFETKMKQDPFRQAEGYKFTLKNKILNNIGKCLFCYAVIFPHVDYAFETTIFDKNILWTMKSAKSYSNSMEKFINSVFEYNRNQHKRYNRTYSKLSKNEIYAIKKVLSPIVKDKNKYNTINTLEWLQISNLEILEGLFKNKRIMIEGPPGSGKTTIAKAYIDQQIGKKGIYICWNNLLMYYMHNILSDRKNNDEIEVTTLIGFLKGLDSDYSINDVLKKTEEQFYDYVKKIIEKLEENEQLPVYDYIVIDEGQDVFDRGIDLIIDKMCGHSKKGLNNGSALVLYDIDQGYRATGRNVIGIADLLNEYFSHFKLNEVKRSAQNLDIKTLSQNIFNNPHFIIDSINNNLYPAITITRHANLEKVKNYIVNNILIQLRNEQSSLRGEQCIVLIESTLLKKSYKDEPGMSYWLTIKDVEELNKNNVSDKSNKLRYTSILKYKGLEKENVFMVVTIPNEKNKYELFVGITRAINNLEIMVVE
jgi:hypothetical protein